MTKDTKLDLNRREEFVKGRDEGDRWALVAAVRGYGESEVKNMMKLGAPYQTLLSLINTSEFWSCPGYPTGFREGLRARAQLMMLEGDSDATTGAVIFFWASGGVGQPTGHDLLQLAAA